VKLVPSFWRNDDPVRLCCWGILLVEVYNHTARPFRLATGWKLPDRRRSYRHWL